MNYKVITDSFKNRKSIRKKSLFTAVAVGLGLTASVWAQVPSYVPTNGLVGWWPFNGNANDASGNGNNGTVNGATLTADRFGNAGKAYSFDGVNDLIQTSCTPVLGSNARSFSFWFKSTALINSNIFFYGSPNPMYGSFRLGISEPFGNCQGISFNVSDGQFTKSQLCNDNVWHQVVFVMEDGDRLMEVSLFWDGQLLNSNNCSDYAGNTPINTLQEFPLVFGKDLYYGSFYTGMLDDIGIWNRALTQQEISDLYNGCSASTITAQPINQSVTPTNSAQFIVKANSGSSFQWQTDLGFGFQNLSNAGQYSGANNDTLVVSNATVSNNNQQFRCILNSGSCSDTSDIAILTVSTAGIEELNPIKFNLYPNPTQSSFEIQTNLVFNKIEIRDMQGRVVKTENAGKTINISSLQHGTYLVQLIDEKSKVISVKRIIKE